MGSASLYQLARRGVQVLGIEQFAAFHDRGSSHGRSRVFRTTYDDPLYVELSLEALELWRSLEHYSSQPLLHLGGLLVFASESNERFERTLATLSQRGLPHETMSGPAAARRFDVFSFDEKIVTFFASQNGMLFADVALQTMHQAARQHGAAVWDRTAVRSIEPSGRQVKIATDGSTITADQVVITAGPWLNSLLQDFDLPLNVTRERKVYFDVDDPSRYRLERLPVFVEYDTQIYSLPVHSDVGLKVAADHAGDTVDPDHVRRDVEQEYVEQIASWVRRWLPGAAPQATDASVCLYTTTPDKDFVIDRHPRNSQITVAGGFSGHGFKFSVLVGDIVADLVIDGSTTRNIDRFRISRF